MKKKYLTLCLENLFTAISKCQYPNYKLLFSYKQPALAPTYDIHDWKLSNDFKALPKKCKNQMGKYYQLYSIMFI